MDNGPIFSTGVSGAGCKWLNREVREFCEFEAVGGVLYAGALLPRYRENILLSCYILTIFLDWAVTKYFRASDSV